MAYLVRMATLSLLLAALSLPAFPADLAVDAAPTPVRLAANETLRFELRTPQARRLTVGLRDLVFEPASAAGVALRVRKADGTSAGADWTHCSPPNMRPACLVELVAEAGVRYVIDVEAPFSAAARFSLGAARVASWPAEGTPLTEVAPLLMKEPQRFAIEVKSGELVTVGIADIKHEAAPGTSGSPVLSLHNADGSQRASAACRPNTPTCKLSFGSLPAGTYTLQVRPSHGGTLSAKPLRSADAVSKLGDAAQPVSTVKAGQLLRLEFPAEAGQSITLNVSDLRREGPVELRVLAPQGHMTALRTVGPADTSVEVTAMARSGGTHTLVIDPGLSTLSATVTVKR